jgi:hypothetical protein
MQYDDMRKGTQERYVFGTGVNEPKVKSKQKNEHPEAQAKQNMLNIVPSQTNQFSLNSSWEHKVTNHTILARTAGRDQNVDQWKSVMHFKLKTCGDQMFLVHRSHQEETFPGIVLLKNGRGLHVQRHYKENCSSISKNDHAFWQHRL